MVSVTPGEVLPQDAFQNFRAPVGRAPPFGESSMRIIARSACRPLAALLFLLLLASAARAATVEPLSWVAADVAGKTNARVALVGVAVIDGHRCGMQIDTGANGAVIWRGEPAEAALQPVSVAFAGISVSSRISAQQLKAVATCQAGDVVGTLGSGFFDQGTLEIDLRKPALRHTDGSLLAREKNAAPLFYPRWGDSGGHPLVEVRDGPARVGYALLDTGSASAGVGVLSADAWSRLTSKAPLEKGALVDVASVPSWGRDHSCYFYKRSIYIQVGNSPAREVFVHYCPTLGFKPGIELVGVLGLQYFGNETLVIDYVAGRWMAQ